MSMVMISIQRFIKSSFTENLGLKLIAAIIAVLLYLLVVFQEEAERIIDVEIVPPNPDQISELVLANENELPSSIKVRIRGRASMVKSVKQEEIEPVNVVPQEWKEGTSQYYFSDEKLEEVFKKWPDIEFVRVTPESIPIRLEKLVSRRLPVRIRTYGKLKTGTEFAEEPSVTPSVLTVTGAASIIRGLEVVETEAVDIDGRGVGENIFIVAARQIDGVSIPKVDELNVMMKVRWIRGQRMISGLLLRARGTELAAELRPKEVAVALTGPQVALDKLDPSKVIPLVTIEEELKNRLGTHLGKVAVEGLPDDIRVTSIVPSKVQVKLTMAGVVKKKKAGQEP
ncbi:MAG: hypothetical protein GY854_00435 [Deltaproteobacteria bacterium]|nr:hypothetical protein [Deltaproteobacteria bacterium]